MQDFLNVLEDYSEEEEDDGREEDNKEDREDDRGDREDRKEESGVVKNLKVLTLEPATEVSGQRQEWKERYMSAIQNSRSLIRKMKEKEGSPEVRMKV